MAAFTLSYTRIFSGIFLIIFMLLKLDGGAQFIDENSVAIRNAKWLEDNRLYWYHYYALDTMKTLANATATTDEDDSKAVNLDEALDLDKLQTRLRKLCEAEHFANFSKDCAMDLKFFICSTTNLIAASLKRTLNATTEKISSKNFDIWPSKYLDAFGKVSGGLELGNYLYLGNYEQCTQLRVRKSRPFSSSPRRDFEGKYCYVTMGTPLSETRMRVGAACRGLNEETRCDPNKIYTIKLGVCAPKSCSIRELNGIYFKIMNKTASPVCKPENPKLKPPVMCVERAPFSSDAPAISMTTVCILFALLLIAATAYDLILRNILTLEWLGCFPGHQKRQATNTDGHGFEILDQRNHVDPPNEQGKLAQLFLAFSLYTNGYNLLNADRQAKKFICLDAVRVFSLAWIVYAQAYLIIIDYVDNVRAVTKLPASFSFQAVNNASLATDTFFLLGGLLNVYIWMKKSSNDDGDKPKFFIVQWIFSLLKKLIRILLPYMMVIGMATAFWPRLGEGPMWLVAQYSKFGPFLCKFTWWSNLLFINNFVVLDYACLSWTWYVAADMQIFIIAAPLLFLYKRKPLAAVLVSLVLGVLSIILNCILVVSYNLAPSVLGSTDLNKIQSINGFYRHIFVKPYMRWNAYLIGMFVGYVFFKSEKQPNNFRFLTRKLIRGIVWIASLLICSAVVYGVFEFARGHRVSVVSAALYSSISRSAWSAAVGLIILLCLQPGEGVIRWFLRWPIWTPLGRITYCAFLVHGMAVLFFYGTSKESLRATPFNMFYYWFSSLIISYAFGFGLSLCFEQPAIRIGRILFDRRTNNTTGEQETATALRLLEHEHAHESDISNMKK